MRNQFLVIFSLVMFSVSSQAAEDCSRFNHGRSYWITEEGVPYWRQYALTSDCKAIDIQKMFDQKTNGALYTDKIDGKFYCVEHSSNGCKFGYSWSFKNPDTLNSRVETIQTAFGGGRLVKVVILRDINSKPNKELDELLVVETYYKDPGEDWFLARTNRAKCSLRADTCRWNEQIQR